MQMTDALASVGRVRKIAADDMETPPPDADLPPAEVDAPVGLTCPNCGAPVDAAHVSGPIAQCPACGTQFFPPALDDVDLADATETGGETEASAQSESELEALRIRHFSVLRRSAYRTRSYFIVGVVACLILAIQLVIWVVGDIRHGAGWRGRPIIYLLTAGAALVGAFEFWLHVARVQRAIDAEVAARALEELEAARHEPDFSMLSDGSHHARNLELMTGGGGDPAAGSDVAPAIDPGE